MTENDKRRVRLEIDDPILHECLESAHLHHALIADPIQTADKYALLWSAHQAVLAIKRAMRG